MNYLSVCSGIEAASVAWHPLGWNPLAFSEIEKFPSAVLAHHWPDVPNLGDMTKHHDWPTNIRPELIVGGTPCQAFSVAGLRKGLEDPRGNLTLVFLGILAQYRPRWVVWENVPGVLSEKTGAFGSFLGGMGELGYGFAYRVLDAQHFGVPQRRRRVFVVGHLGDWRRAAAVLFEPASLRGDHPPCREERSSVAALTANGVGTCGADDNQAQAGHLISPAVTSKWAKGSGGPSGDECQNLVAHTTGAGYWQEGFGTLRARAQDSHENLAIAIQAGAIKENPNHGPDGVGVRTDGKAYTLEARSEVQAVAYRTSGNCGAWETGDKTDALTTSTDPFSHVLELQATVRRLTPRECERLQGFPDDHTLVPWRGKMSPDGPRYKAIGNSMAVPVMRWIGERIESIDRLGGAAEPGGIPQ